MLHFWVAHEPGQQKDGCFFGRMTPFAANKDVSVKTAIARVLLPHNSFSRYNMTIKYICVQRSSLSLQQRCRARDGDTIGGVAKFKLAILATCTPSGQVIAILGIITNLPHRHMMRGCFCFVMLQLTSGRLLRTVRGTQCMRGCTTTRYFSSTYERTIIDEQPGLARACSTA
jgi:hypothetical protein